MGEIFSAFRTLPFPTLYGPMKTAVTADVLEAGFLYAVAIVAFSFLVILIPLLTQLKKDLALTTVRIMAALYIMSCIMLCNFGQEWEVAKIHTKTPYKAYIGKEISADIGLKIGLRSINVTLKTEPVEQKLNNRTTETINYNERFSWDNQGWTQGRLGFGPNAGKFNQEFRAGQNKGLPYPILWIAEYFTIDGEGIRWGRWYRQAGYYTHICIWLALPVWWLTCILFHMVLIYGSLGMTFTGILLVTGNVLFSNLRNLNTLVIPWEEGRMELHWGWCWWLNLINGCILTVVGAIMSLIAWKRVELIESFFGRDPAQDLEEVYGVVDWDTIPGGRPKDDSEPKDAFRPGRSEQPPADEDEAIDGEEGVAAAAANGSAPRPSVQFEEPDENIYENTMPTKRVFRKRMQTIDATKKTRTRTKQRSVKRKQPQAAPRGQPKDDQPKLPQRSTPDDDDSDGDQVDYENVDIEMGNMKPDPERLRDRPAPPLPTKGGKHKRDSLA